MMSTRRPSAELEREFDADLTLVDCPDCGEPVARKCVGMHRAQSTFCRWSRARTEVATLWAAGWRDPFTVPDAPLTWTALHARVAWKRRVRTVEFPRWVAVLLSPENG